MNREEQLQALLNDLRRKQAYWLLQADRMINHPDFEAWLGPLGKADAYQDAADQIEVVG